MSATGEHFHDRDTVDVDVEPEGKKPRRSRRSSRALITDLKHSPEQNRQSREKQYLILQGIRLPFILLSLVAAFGWNNWGLASIFFLISVPLPWISVMVANGEGEVRDARSRNVYKPAVAREEAYRLEAARQAQLNQASQSGSAQAPSIIEHDD
ncbi:DUF3099 domain-containing protein [Corynebacterium aquatimens]|uniref:DUF3099 domain-containing protein n=1 Tax=Corynebacterium TaxID=1716 RepID=UPI001F34DAC7|nr:MULTISPECIES: DUF3099 domain-containing protein [Corynebacterium]QYH19635.1 DUF3099 domain-containing protein [Corynebacterium aquatimens]UIZ91376.1 DUF3099 domain-containing protein [Corynebacterium sp. CNCTC7651]